MPEKDSQERAGPAYRERDRARLEDVSSDSGEETGVPASAGAPVLIPTGWEDLWKKDDERYCRAPGGFVHYRQREDRLEYDVAEPDPETPPPAPAVRGPKQKGITGREAIIDAELAEVTYVMLSPEEFAAMRADGRWAAILTTAPEPGTRAWQRYRARLAGRAQNVNTAAQATLYCVSEQTIRDWRKTWGNSGVSTGTFSTPAVELDRFEIRGDRLYVVVKVPDRLKEMPPDFMDKLSTTLSAIHANTEALVETQAELRAIMLESVEILRANFLGDHRVALAVDRFVADALADAD